MDSPEDARALNDLMIGAIENDERWRSGLDDESSSQSLSWAEEQVGAIVATEDLDESRALGRARQVRHALNLMAHLIGGRTRMSAQDRDGVWSDLLAVLEAVPEFDLGSVLPRLPTQEVFWRLEPSELVRRLLAMVGFRSEFQAP